MLMAGVDMEEWVVGSMREQAHLVLGMKVVARMNRQAHKAAGMEVVVPGTMALVAPS